MYYLDTSNRGGRRDSPGIAVEPSTRGGSADTTVFSGTDTDNTVVNGAGYAVSNLNVKFGQNVLLVNTGLADVTDGSVLDHVPDAEPLDGLIFGDHTVAVGATKALDVATVALVTAVVSSLLRHGELGRVRLRMKQ